MNTLNSGVSFAATAAIVAIAAVATATPVLAHGAKQVHCFGISSCKGTSDCKTAHNDCKGQNSCKGQGFKALTVKACKAAGGSLTEPK